MLQILIVDDHAIVRRGLRDILHDAFKEVACGEAHNASQALTLSRTQEWDVVLLDINMPGRSGLEVLGDLKQEKPGLPVLILSMYPQEQFAVRAFRAGAAGYLTKAGAPEELVKAIRTVLQGRKYVSLSLAETLAVGIEEKREKPLHELLSEREYQVMLRLATGQTPTAIAIEMTLSVKTVSTYRLRLLKKLRANNNAELAAYAIRNQLMD